VRRHQHRGTLAATAHRRGFRRRARRERREKPRTERLGLSRITLVSQHVQHKRRVRRDVRPTVRRCSPRGIEHARHLVEATHARERGQLQVD
jgi:hypothetical protein